MPTHHTQTHSEPAQRTPKGRQVANQLRAMILHGEIPTGSPLRQVALARKLGTSTIPFREAVRSLEQEGLLVWHPYRGVEVPPLVPEELIEFAHIRVALEVELLAMALPMHTPETLRHARECLAAIGQAPRRAPRFHAYSRFIEALYKPAARPRMLAEIMRFVALSERFFYLLADSLHLVPAWLPKLSDVLDAMDAGDLEKAQQQLRHLYEHTAILGASLLFQDQLEQKPTVRRPRGRPRKHPLP